MPDAKPNPKLASEYIRSGFRPRDRHALFLLHRRSGGVIQRVVNAEDIASDETLQWLARKNSQGFEVYVGMNALKPEAQGRTKGGHRRHPTPLSRPRPRRGSGALEPPSSGRHARAQPRPRHVSGKAPGRLEGRAVHARPSRIATATTRGRIRRRPSRYRRSARLAPARVPEPQIRAAARRRECARCRSARTNLLTFAVSETGLSSNRYNPRRALRREPAPATSRNPSAIGRTPSASYGEAEIRAPSQTLSPSSARAISPTPATYAERTVQRAGEVLAAEGRSQSGPDR